MSKTYVFTAEFKQTDEAVEVSFPDLPGLHTFGDGMDEAVYMAVDALSTYILALVDLGLEIPCDSGIRNRKIQVTV